MTHPARMCPGRRLRVGIWRAYAIVWCAVFGACGPEAALPHKASEPYASGQSFASGDDDNDPRGADSSASPVPALEHRFRASRACADDGSIAPLYDTLRAVWPEANDIDLALDVQGGSGARSYAVIVDGMVYHAKHKCIAGEGEADAFAHEIDSARRASEWQVGARVVFSDVQEGILVTEYLAHDTGQVEAAAQTPQAGHRIGHASDKNKHGHRRRRNTYRSAPDQEETLLLNKAERFARALGRLHAVPTSDVSSTYLERPKHLVLDALDLVSSMPDDSVSCPPSTMMLHVVETGTQDIIERLRSFGVHLSWCHGDAHFGNFIDSESQTQLIDWADMHLGDPVNDLACVARTLKDAQAVTLRFARNNHAAGPKLAARAALYTVLYELRMYLDDVRLGNAALSCDAWRRREWTLAHAIDDALTL